MITNKHRALKYQKDAKITAKAIRSCLKLTALDAKLTSWGFDWWATKADIQPKETLGNLVSWPSLQKSHPEILEIFVVRKTPATDAPWKSACTVGKYEDNAFHQKTEIRVNFGGIFFPHPSYLQKSLAHEVAHLIQMKQGRFTTSLHHHTPGYKEHPLEQEAQLLANTILLIPWPEKYLGPQKNYPYFLPSFALPKPSPHAS